jgi:hypothetical protein
LAFNRGREIIIRVSAALDLAWDEETWTSLAPEPTSSIIASAGEGDETKRQMLEHLLAEEEAKPNSLTQAPTRKRSFEA